MIVLTYLSIQLTFLYFLICAIRRRRTTGRMTIGLFYHKGCSVKIQIYQSPCLKKESWYELRFLKITFEFVEYKIKNKRILNCNLGHALQLYALCKHDEVHNRKQQNFYNTIELNIKNTKIMIKSKTPAYVRQLPTSGVARISKNAIDIMDTYIGTLSSNDTRLQCCHIATTFTIT